MGDYSNGYIVRQDIIFVPWALWGPWDPINCSIGPLGPQGPQGALGAQGAQGAQGAPSPMGPSRTDGVRAAGGQAAAADSGLRAVRGRAEHWKINRNNDIGHGRFGGVYANCCEIQQFVYTQPRGAARPRGGVCRKCCILQHFAYTPPNRPHQPFPYFF